MKFELERYGFADNLTAGILRICKGIELHTLEPPVRPDADHPKGCIPCGVYELKATYSPRFGKELPLLEGVPGFEGIRIHFGFLPTHTKGCICIREKDGAELLTLLLTFLKNEKHTISIRNVF